MGKCKRSVLQGAHLHKITSGRVEKQARNRIEDSEAFSSGGTSRAVACQAKNAGIGAVVAHTDRQQLHLLEKELKRQEVWPIHVSTWLEHVLINHPGAP